MTARVVSTRPLVFDVLDPDSSMKREAEGTCGLGVFPVVDAKLKPVLSRLKFNQVVRANLFYGGNPDYPQELVLSELALDARPDGGAGVCPNRSGIVISYRSAVEYVNVYSDGSIYFRDGYFNSFGTQKISPDELAQLLKAFGDSSFDRLPSSPPPVGKPDRNSLTLVCARHQRVSLSGLETKIAPLLRRLDALKDRATSQTFYMLLVNGRRKLTILEWPFRKVLLSQIETNVKTRQGAPIPAAIHDPVPSDFLSKLPPAGTISVPDPDPYTYVTDAGQMYRVICACSGSPHCNTFDDLRITRVLPAAVTLADSNPAVGLYLPGGLLWPGDLGIDIAQIG